MVLIVPLLVACVGTSRESGPECPEDGVTYVGPGGEALTFRSGSVYRSSFWVTEEEAPIGIPRLEYDYETCDTDHARCVEIFGGVLAMPRGRLEVGSSFDIAGAVVRVVECVEETPQGACAVAVMTAVCQEDVQVAPGKASRNGCDPVLRGPSRMVYVAGRGRGVVVYEVDLAYRHGVEWDVKGFQGTLGSFRLRSDVGLLACS